MRGEVELRCGQQWSDVASTQAVRFFGELLGIVEVQRTSDWIERCVLYRADDGRVVIHHMRLSLREDGVGVAEAYILPALDAGEGGAGRDE